MRESIKSEELLQLLAEFLDPLTKCIRRYARELLQHFFRLEI